MQYICAILDPFGGQEEISNTIVYSQHGIKHQASVGMHKHHQDRLQPHGQKRTVATIAKSYIVKSASNQQAEI